MNKPSYSDIHCSTFASCHIAHTLRREKRKEHRAIKKENGTTKHTLTHTTIKKNWTNKHHHISKQKLSVHEQPIPKRKEDERQSYPKEQMRHAYIPK